ncbi:hypothetical protein [Natrinema pallidum]|uniref:Uncharacterized protein n=2 Tax=Natrinema pallidum TaxID=69527 RepID=L9Z7J7_9EURY|nr:hypothetical protein [Natrinema pallidum]ELY82470.1 hypothetical protein C487_02091 [Natrinema pallidum DSM 3751]QCW04667.1 hypothetical protein FGF80_16175 [Natrinema pallidum]
MEERVEFARADANRKRGPRLGGHWEFLQGSVEKTARSVRSPDAIRSTGGDCAAAGGTRRRLEIR